MTKQWLAQHFLSHGGRRSEYPSVLLLAAKWLIFLLLLLPHGIAQHIPANYSLVRSHAQPMDVWPVCGGGAGLVTAHLQDELVIGRR